MQTQETILQALRAIKYPGYSRDIVSFGIVRDIVIEGPNVRVLLMLTSNAAQVAQQIRESVDKAIRELPGVEAVQVEARLQSGASPTQDPWAGQSRIAGVRHIVAVASGKGGVGKSTVSVNLACALKQLGARVGLLDSDIYGPSIPLMMGTTERPTVSDEEKMVPPEKHGIKLMSVGFLIDPDTALIWRGPMIMKTLQQFLHEVEWGQLDYLLIDLPPGTGDAQLTVCQTVPLDGGVVVTTPQEASVSVVRKGVAMFEKVNVPILGIVENMSYFTAPNGERLEIFGNGGGRAEAQRKGVPFLGEIPIFTEIRQGGDQGIPVVAGAPASQPARAFLAIAEALRKRLP
jgi:ATP-binding protein involved in chromosome partitioning